MLLLEEVNLEGQNAEHLLHIALEVFDAVFLPCPYLRCDIVVCTWRVGIGMLCAVVLQKLADAEVESGIVNGDDDVGLPLQNVALAHRHVTHDGRQVHQDRDEPHICQLLIVADTRTPYGGHIVTAEEPELCLGIFVLQGFHKMRGMQVA